MLVLAVMLILLAGCGEGESTEECATYRSCIAAQSERQLRHRENLALWYNHALAQGEETADVDGCGLIAFEGIIAVVELPRGGETIPVYAQSGEGGFALAEGSALPVGGQKLPAVLVYYDNWEGELPAAGECFWICVLDRVLCYRIVGGSEGKTEQDVCRLQISVDGEPVTLVGVRVYPETDFDGKN